MLRRWLNFSRCFSSQNSNEGLKLSGYDKIYRSHYYKIVDVVNNMEFLKEEREKFLKSPMNDRDSARYARALSHWGYNFEALKLLRTSMDRYRFSNPIRYFWVVRQYQQINKVKWLPIGRAPIEAIHLGAILLGFISLIILDYSVKKYKSFKKKSASHTIPKPPKKIVMFDDVIGIEEYKEELVDIVNYLKNPALYKHMGAEIPKGVLLEGPPGVGKTLLGKALANEANWKFLYASGSQFEQVFVGVGAKNVRALFDEARKHPSAIIFIDEIDSVAQKRSGKKFYFNTGTLNQLLVEMDGFHKDANIIVIGATNRANELDEAIKRPGRFDKVISIPAPDMKAREKLFQYYVKKIKAEDGIDFNYLARQTTRWSGADIKNIVNKSIIRAIKKEKTKASLEDFEEVIEDLFLGTRRKHNITSEDKKLRSSIYEASKALMSLIYPDAEPVYKITILAKGQSKSQTVTKSMEDQLNYNKKQLHAMIVTLVTGRVAEQMFYGEISSRWSEDYKKAVNLCLMYIKKMAMEESTSLISAEKDQMSDLYNSKLEAQARILLEKMIGESQTLLSKRRDDVQAIANVLVEKETLDKAQIMKILGLEIPKPSPE